MATTLVGNTYIGNETPTPALGYFWVKDDGTYYSSNTAATAWVLLGSVGQTALGQMPRAGGVATGAFTGSHGLMPLTGGDFSAAPTVNGANIAMQSYVDSKVTWILSQINKVVAQQIASMPGLSINNSVVFNAGVSEEVGNNGTFTIPLPTYADGVIATQAEVTGRYSAWPARWGVADGVVSFSTGEVQVYETVAGSRIFKIVSTNIQNPVPDLGKIGYVIMAIRA